MANYIIRNCKNRGYVTQDDVIRVGQLYRKGEATKDQFKWVVNNCEAVVNKAFVINKVIG